MAYSLDGKLVVGISSRALFDLAEEDAVFHSEGLAVYRQLQREREDVPLRPGTGFRLVRALLAINGLRPDRRLVEVIILSKNDGDSGIRIFNSIRHHGLDISRAALTGGRPVARFLRPFRAQLFLSAEAGEVAAALEQGIPAALVLAPPPDGPAKRAREDVLIAFDGDAVLFDEDADRIHRLEGLEAFTAHERTNARVPMRAGPFEPFLRALARLQATFPDGAAPIRTALVTARGAPAHERVITTLRHWGVRLDESYFLGGISKREVVEALEPLIFFDDQLANLADAQDLVPAAHVPYEGGQRLLFTPDAVNVPVSSGPVAEVPPQSAPPVSARAKSPQPSSARRRSGTPRSRPAAIAADLLEPPADPVATRVRAGTLSRP